MSFLHNKSSSRDKNKDNVFTYSEKYSKEFKPSKNKEYFKIGTKVLLKYKNKVNEMEPKFKEFGSVTKVLTDNTYLVKTEKGILKVRHYGQLEAFGD